MTALRAGPNGHVLKTAEPEEIVAAVRAVNEGQSALDPSIMRKLIAQLVGEDKLARFDETGGLRVEARGLDKRPAASRHGQHERHVAPGRAYRQAAPGG